MCSCVFFNLSLFATFLQYFFIFTLNSIYNIKVRKPCYTQNECAKAAKKIIVLIVQLDVYDFFLGLSPILHITAKLYEYFRKLFFLYLVILCISYTIYFMNAIKKILLFLLQ